MVHYVWSENENTAIPVNEWNEEISLQSERKCKKNLHGTQNILLYTVVVYNTQQAPQVITT